MRKLIVATLFIIVLAALIWFRFAPASRGETPRWEVKQGSLVSPNLVQTIFSKPKPTPSPSPKISRASLRVKTFKFDSSTDLKKELDSVNPQILDSDFQ